MARVAVVTRTKNRPLMLPRARKSIEGQDFRDFVWVLVNDAGETEYVDQNAEIARNAGVEVQVVHRPISTGMEAASNAGVSAVLSEFIVVHDDDDSWHPSFLRKCVNFLVERPEYQGVTCLSQAIRERVEPGRIVELKRYPYNDKLQSIQLADMVQINLFAPISFLFRRSVYEAVGGYDEELPVLGDWDFNLRVLLRGDIGLIPEMLANYHIREFVDPNQIEYGNSITAGVNFHMLQDAIYRNRKLRLDIENGTVGLGYLLSQGWQMHKLSLNVNFLTKVVRLPQTFWRKIRRNLGIR